MLIRVVVRCSDKKEEGLLLKEKVVTTEHFIYIARDLCKTTLEPSAS